MSSKVQSWAALGLSPQQLRKKTEEWAASSTYKVNGVIMTAERPLPGDFPEVADRFLDQVFLEKGGEARFPGGAEDLYLQPVSGETKWQVWDKNTGLPIGAVYLDDKAMQGVRDAKTAEFEKLKAEEYRLKAEGDEIKREAMKPMWQEFYQKEQARIDALRVPQKSWLNGYNMPNNAAADAAQEALDRMMYEAGLPHLMSTAKKPEVNSSPPKMGN